MTMQIEQLAFLAPGAAVALGAVFAAKSFSLRRKSAICALWPTVAGKIIGSRIDTMVEENLTAVEDRRACRERELSSATVRYAYRVGDREYQSTRLYVGRPVFSGNLRAAASIVAKYPRNVQVSVHYNPDNPAEAMLEPSNFANANLALGVAVGFGGLGLLALLLVWNIQ